MFTLRRLAASHLFVFTILLAIASVRPAYGQTATLSNTSRSFGNVAVGSTSAASTITLRNTSTTLPLAVSNIATSGDFSQTNTCGTSLAPSTSCTISITFTASLVNNPQVASLIVSDNAQGGAQSVALYGVATKQ